MRLTTQALALQTKGGRPRRIKVKALDGGLFTVHPTVKADHIKFIDQLSKTNTLPYVAVARDFALTQKATGRQILSGIYCEAKAMEAAVILAKWAGEALDFNRVRDFTVRKQYMVSRALAVIVVGRKLAKVSPEVKDFLAKIYSRLDDSVDAKNKKRAN